MSRELDFNRQLVEMLNDVKYTWRQNAIVLGGSSGSGGGGGSPPGGFIGQLGQSQVCGDTDELRVLSSGSATSLLWNLNRMRYWLTNQISATPPATTFAGQIWVDGSSGSTLNIRNEADTAWITITSGSGGSGVLDPNSPQDVGAAAVVGSSGSSAHGNHVHRGIHGIYNPSNSFAYGDIALIGSGNVNIAQSSGSFTWTTSGSFVPVQHGINGVYHTGYPLTVANGGLGTTQAPTAGAIPIGTTGGIYAPNHIVAGMGQRITKSSGSITLSDSNAPYQLVANPHMGSAIDQCVVRACVDGKVYWSSHRAQGSSTALGYEYAYNTLTDVNSEIQSAAGKALWKSVYNASDGLIYAVGQVYADSITYRACVMTIDPATDTVATYVLNATGEATGDTNELVAILDDDTQLVTGERMGGGLTTGSDYPNGGGLWIVPKATIGTVSSYTRVYEDTHSPTWEWTCLAKLGSTYFNFIIPYSGGKFQIQHSTNLTSWTTDIDGSALALSDDIRGQLIKHNGRNRLYAAVVNSSRQVVLHQYDGADWTNTTFTNLVMPSSGEVDLSLSEHGSDLLLTVGRYSTETHDIYLISQLGDAPMWGLLYSGGAGLYPHGKAVFGGADVYYAVSSPISYSSTPTGGLNKVRLWSGSDTRGTISGNSQAVFTAEGTLSAGTGSLRIYNVLGRTATISKVFLSVDTPSSGSAIICDVNNGGTTIFTSQANRPQIATGANTGYTTTIDVPAWADGEYLTLDRDQVGSVVPGSNLTCHIVYS